jgi:hypothetical protein
MGRKWNKNKRKKDDSTNNQRKCLQQECIHCSNATLTKYNIRKREITFDDLPSPISSKTITCTRCGLKSCHDCLSKFIDVSKNSSSSLYQSLIDNNKWFRDIDEFISTNRTPCNFIGSCCTVTVDKDEEDPQGGCDISTKNHGFEGYLHVHPYNLLIKPTFHKNCMSVLSIAGDNKLGTDAAMHAVVDQTLAESNRKINFHPSDNGVHKKSTEFLHTFKIPDHFGEGKNEYMVRKWILWLSYFLFLFIIILTYHFISFVCCN